MAYTKEEIKVFEDKELRIVRQAILKKLIDNCSKEDVYGVTKVTELTERYVDYVYSERSNGAERRDATKRGLAKPTSSADAGCVASNTEGTKWEQIAQGLNLAIPNSQNIKMLNLLLDEYKKAYKASANPDSILVHIINTFGEYPTKTKSVETVLKSLNKEN